MAVNEIMAPTVNANCQYSTRYCWEAEKVKSLIRLRAELSPLFTGKRNASKYAWAVVERELNVPLPLSKIIKKWNNLLQEYKAIKMSEEPKRREWPFFTLMDVYFSDQVNDPSLRLFSSTKTLKETLDDSVFEDDPIIASAIAAATSGAYMEIDELIRRQKERAALAAERKLAAAASGASGDYKYDLKPMLANNNSSNKFNSNSEMVKLSKSVDDLSMQQYKIKQELMRQREQEQQENMVKIKQHARQQQQQHQQQQQQHQQQQQQQQHHQAQQQQQQQQQQRFMSHQPSLSPHPHRLSSSSTPPGLQHALQQQQHLLQQQQQQLQQHLQQQQQQAQQQLQQQQQHHHQIAHPHQPPTPRPSSPPTTAQQIHITATQHQAAQQQLQQQQQQQHHKQHQHQQQQQQPYTDPNTIDQYLLSWNNFHGNMCRGFHSLQKDEKMVDVTIAAGGKIFKAHKLVLSVCSPYFQQIFLENPSSHPILLMADVEASHMAGLLDFMYSGQVNVKYEDLPVFLKVAEAMKIKGLHTEKNLDSDASDISSPLESDGTECRYERGTHSVNITSGHAAGYGATALEQSSLNGPNRCPTPLSLASPGGNQAQTQAQGQGQGQGQGYAGFREHIKSKATLAESFIKNLNRNNNNNSNSANNNNNYSALSNNNNASNPSLADAESNSYAILQANSKKMLDSARKQHKYLAKRKILMHYNTELGGEKRLKEMERERYPSAEQHDDALNNNHSHAYGHGQDIMEPIATVVPRTPEPQPPPSTHNNNFKIRLVESHHLTNSSSSSSNNNNNNSSNNCSNNSQPDDEEALNLVQTPNVNGNRARPQTPTPPPDIQLVKREVEFEASPSEITHNSNNHNKNGHDEDLAAYERKYDDNNNNRGLDVETDSNNNNSSNKGNNEPNNNNGLGAGLALALGKHKLFNAINRNLELEQQHITERERERERERSDATEHGGSKNNSSNGEHDNDDNNNNNNSHSQHLDLSTIKNIATAEILCGLKSKVLKLEEEQRERERERERERDACRNLSEIKNAD